MGDFAAWAFERAAGERLGAILEKHARSVKESLQTVQRMVVERAALDRPGGPTD
jgi:hypothetical protein